jgi:hypothetical protein
LLIDDRDRELLLPYFLFTGSKVETPATAIVITARTTPPATTLKSKFFKDGLMPGCAASASSGTTAAANKANAVRLVTSCSFCETLMVTLLVFLVTSLEENLLLGEAARVNPLDTDTEVRDWVLMATGVTQTTAAAPTAEAHAAISNCRIDRGSRSCKESAKRRDVGTERRNAMM